ncbi:MAG: HAD family hydrolase [Oleiphilus sp.]|nr:MAG: HAD family hydrolase [Oleiphilus sp.]
MKVKAVILDWDGTLVDSEAHIVACISEAARQMGLPDLGYDEKKNIIGLGMREALNTLYPDLNEEQIDQMRKYYSGHFFGPGAEQVKLFPRVLESLQQIRRRGVRLAVATGKSRNGLNKALQSTGLGPLFDIERCADETKSKPDPMMLREIADFYQYDFDEMLMVGDTTYDLMMAGAVGMPAVAVNYGVHSVERLRALEPKKVISCFSELVTLI